MSVNKLTKDSVDPDDIIVLGYSLPFGDREKEDVAKKIIMISSWNAGWFSFTWEQYKEKCGVIAVCISEKTTLNILVAQGYLSKKGGIYSVKDEFIQFLGNFVRNTVIAEIVV